MVHGALRGLAPAYTPTMFFRQFGRDDGHVKRESVAIPTVAI